MTATNINLNAAEKKVLTFLADEWSDEAGFYGFKWIGKRTRLPRNKVRLACRSLKRKGLTKFASGLWTDDGTPGGSGYSATKEGRALIDNARPPDKEMQRILAQLQASHGA